MAYIKEPIKNLAGDILLPPTIFEQVKVSETNNKNLKQVLEEEMAEKTHNHNDLYYTKQEVDQKDQKLIEGIENISKESYYTKTEVDQKENNLREIIEEITEEVYTKTEVDQKEVALQNTDTNLSSRITKLETQIMFGTEEPDDGDTLEPGSIYMVFEE